MQKLLYFLLIFWTTLLCSASLRNVEKALITHTNLPSSTLEELHTKGIDNFLDRNYASALSNFNQLLNLCSFSTSSEIGLIGSALWGRALCYAQLNQPEETFKNLNLLYAYFLTDTSCLCRNISHSVTNYEWSQVQPSYFLLPVVQFANPNELIYPSECQERVRGTVYRIKELLADHFGRGTIGYQTFATFIENLEVKAMRCCMGANNASNIWVTCLTPLIEKLDQWKKKMPLNPYSL